MGEFVDIDQAAAIVDRDGLVVVPTETVYGLAGKPTPEIVERIFELKRRPAGKPMQLLIPEALWLERLGAPSDAARTLAAAFWPGPLTLVVVANDEAPSALTSDGAIGLRVPAHPIALELLARCGPLAASSANESGQPTPSTIEEVREIFGAGVDGYLEGGGFDASADGRGSTVVDLTTSRPNVLREGSISAREVLRLLGARFDGP